MTIEKDILTVETQMRITQYLLKPTLLKEYAT